MSSAISISSNDEERQDLLSEGTIVDRDRLPRRFAGATTFLVILAWAAYCSVLLTSPSSQTTQKSYEDNQGFYLYSPTFLAGEQLPTNYTCDAPCYPDTDRVLDDGSYQNNPPLAWENEPDGTVEYLILLTTHVLTLQENYFRIDFSVWNFSASCGEKQLPYMARSGFCGLAFGGSYSFSDDYYTLGQEPDE